MPEDHKVIDAGARDEVNTSNTSDYDTTMDLDVAHIEKNDKNKWRTIYEAIDEHYFG